MAIRCTKCGATRPPARPGQGIDGWAYDWRTGWRCPNDRRVTLEEQKIAEKRAVSAQRHPSSCNKEK